MLSRVPRDYLILFFLVLVAIASGADMIADSSEGVNTTHLLQEAAILLIAILGVSLIALSLIKKRHEIRDLHTELDQIKNLPLPDSRELMDSKRRLSEVISQQFDLWKLTRSEREIGMLLLKGFSFKEIAALRERTEKTIRQQASAIYQKSGLPGRHALSAWFIEDIL